MTRYVFGLIGLVAVGLSACNSAVESTDGSDPTISEPVGQTEAAESIPDSAPGYPEGKYLMVSARSASDVASPPIEDQDIPHGATVEFISPTDIRMDGASCDDWQILGSNSPTIFPDQDPLLFDIAMPGDGTTDHRHNITYEIFCEGESVTKFLRIDDRVLVFPDQNSAINLIFEKPLSTAATTQLQHALNAAGLNAGEVDGMLNETTIQAVRDWLFRHPGMGESQGVAARPAITENLLMHMLNEDRP